MRAGLRFFIAWLFLVSLAGAAGARPMTLGLVAPPAEPDATSLLRGVQLAVAEANETDPATVGLEVRSENGQWGTVGNDAVILACDRHVDALIAPSDGAASHLILQVSGRTRVPVASVCPDSSVTEAGVPWTVRVVPRTDQQAAALFAAESQPDRPALVWWAAIPANRPGRVVRRDLEAAARASGTRLDRILNADDPKTDLASLVHTIVAAAPGGVLLWLPPSQAGATVAALRAAGYGGCLAGPGSLDSPAFMVAAGAAATGVRVTEFRADGDLPLRADEFARRFRQRYGAEPDFSAAAGYDAARVLIETLSRSPAGDGYRQFPLALPTRGVTGVLHFDNFGNRTDPLWVLIWQQGRFIPLRPKPTQL